MLRTSRVLPLLSGVAVATLMAGGIALALSGGSADDPPPVIVEPAATAADEPDEVTEEPEPEPEPEVELTVLATGPLTAIEAGSTPPKTRAKKVEPVEEVAPVVEQKPAKVTQTKPKAKAKQDGKKAKVDDGKKHKKHDKKKHDGKKYDKKKHDKKEHDGTGAWWPSVLGAHVSGCSFADGAASVDWIVKVGGGSGWSIVDNGGAGDVHGPDGDKAKLFYSSTSNELHEYEEDTFKARVAATITVANGDGDTKSLTVDAWAYQDKHC